MDQSSWALQVERTGSLLSRVEFFEGSGKRLDPDAGFSKWRRMAERIRGAGRAVFFIGNGASASMASHCATDLAKNAHVCAQVFSDFSAITAAANDTGYDRVFATLLEQQAQAGDMLVAISSSGNSPNIIEALKLARRMDLATVTLSAMDPQNSSRALGSLNVYVPAQTYGDAETCHAAILHYWIDTLTDCERPRAAS